MKGFDYSKLSDSKTYDFLRPVGKLVCKMLYDFEYVGLENIPEEGGFILAANHYTALDPVYISVPIEKRQLHFMAKKELYDNKIVAWAFTKLNGFPIVRGSRDKAALDYAIRIPKEGYVLGIFPEGTRSKTFTPGNAKSGVALIAKEAKAPVLPVSIYNTEKMKKRTKVTIRFGKLIPYEELGFTGEDSRDEIREVAKNIMGEINKLWEEGHCE